LLERGGNEKGKEKKEGCLAVRRGNLMGECVRVSEKKGLLCDKHGQKEKKKALCALCQKKRPHDADKGGRAWVYNALRRKDVAFLDSLI